MTPPTARQLRFPLLQSSAHSVWLHLYLLGHNWVTNWHIESQRTLHYFQQEYKQHDHRCWRSTHSGLQAFTSAPHCRPCQQSRRTIKLQLVSGPSRGHLITSSIRAVLSIPKGSERGDKAWWLWAHVTNRGLRPAFCYNVLQICLA